MIAVPPVTLIFRRAASPSQGLLGRRLEGAYACHAADIISLVFLMAFEIAVASLAEGKVTSLFDWFIVLAVFFQPYALLSLAARHYLAKAHAARRSVPTCRMLQRP